jgi:hypothetical protein
MDKLIGIDDVNIIVGTLLGQYKVPFTVQKIGSSAVFEVKMFGTKIIYLDGQTFDKKTTDGWNIGWIHPDYDVNKTRSITVWALVKGGYFHYLRNNYKRTFQSLVNEGWGKSIIEERLRSFKNDPKYNYFRDLNTDAKKLAGIYLLSMDPGFFDFLME